MMSNKDQPVNPDLFENFHNIVIDVESATRAVNRVRFAILNDAKQRPAIPSIWQRSIRWPQVSMGAVGLTLFIAVIALSVFTSTLNTTLFAQVKKNVGSLNTVTFDVKVKMEGHALKSKRMMVRRDGSKRETFPDGRYSVFRMTNGSLTRMDVDPSNNSAHMTYLFSSLDLVDPITALRDLPSSAKVTEIDSRVIDGQTCSGFLVEKALGKKMCQEIQVWISSDTRLPVLMEVIATIISPKGEANDKNRQNLAVATISNFTYDTPLPETLFALSPPEGFTVTSVGTPLQHRSNGFSPDKLLLTVGEGIGPAKFGMTTAEVREVFGEPEDITRERLRQPGAEKWKYTSQGFALTFYPQPGLKLEHISCRYLSNSQGHFSGMTSEGIGLGASREDVRKAYGPPDQDTGGEGGTVFIFLKKRLHIGFNGDRLDFLHFSRILEKSAPEEKEIPTE